MGVFKQDEPQSQNVSLSPDQLKELILSIVSEAKKPSEYEQGKIDKARAIELRAAKEGRELAFAEEHRKAEQKKRCPHHNGQSHTWVAQVHAPDGVDPYFVPTCQRCQTQLPRIRCTGDQAREGIGLNRYKTLDMAALERMAEKLPVGV